MYKDRENMYRKIEKRENVQRDRRENIYRKIEKRER